VYISYVPFILESFINVFLIDIFLLLLTIKLPSNPPVLSLPLTSPLIRILLIFISFSACPDKVPTLLYPFIYELSISILLSVLLDIREAKTPLYNVSLSIISILKLYSFRLVTLASFILLKS